LSVFHRIDLAFEEEEEKEDLCGAMVRSRRRTATTCTLVVPYVQETHKRGGITNTKTAECTLRSQNVLLKRGSFTVTVIPQGTGRYVTRIK
jgi:hypothetical protein